MADMPSCKQTETVYNKMLHMLGGRRTCLYIALRKLKKPTDYKKNYERKSSWTSYDLDEHWILIVSEHEAADLGKRLL